VRYLVSFVSVCIAGLGSLVGVLGGLYLFEQLFAVDSVGYKSILLRPIGPLLIFIVGLVNWSLLNICSRIQNIYALVDTHGTHYSPVEILRFACNGAVVFVALLFWLWVTGDSSGRQKIPLMAVNGEREAIIDLGSLVVSSMVCTCFIVVCSTTRQKHTKPIRSGYFKMALFLPLAILLFAWYWLGALLGLYGLNTLLPDPNGDDVGAFNAMHFLAMLEMIKIGFVLITLGVSFLCIGVSVLYRYLIEGR
jgi:hypothetical protein